MVISKIHKTGRENMYRRIVVISLLLMFSFLSSCDEELATTSSSSTGSTTETNEEQFRLEMLEEINFVRTTPSEYAKARLQSEYDSQNDNGAYEELLSQTVLEPLVLNTQLTSAADKYATFLATNNLFGHTEDGTPDERCKREGYSNYSGENIAAGSYNFYSVSKDPETAAIEFMKMWIIDEGVAGVGHRKNMLSTYHKSVGVGYHFDSNSSYHNYTVQDFGSVE